MFGYDERSRSVNPAHVSHIQREVKMEDVTEAALEQRARRAARRVGLMARKSRWGLGSVDNLGGFMLINPESNFPVEGFRFDLTANYVIEYCAMQAMRRKL